MFYLRLQLCVFVINAAISNAENFEIIRTWKFFEYDTTCLNAPNGVRYTPKNIDTTSLRVYKDRMFVATPRFFGGVPATLSTFDMNQEVESPLLQPFPSWEDQTVSQCQCLQSVASLEVDRFNRLWVLDSGNTATSDPNTASTFCTPKLIIYDLNSATFQNNNNNDTTQCEKLKMIRVIRTYEFPEEVAPRMTALLDDLVIDSNGWYAYISSITDQASGIIVYSARENEAWLVQNDRTMRTQFPSITVNGTTLDLQKIGHVNGIALSPLSNKERTVYYCPAGTYNIYSITTEYLKNPVSPEEFDKKIVTVGQKSNFSDGIMMDNAGTLYFGLLQDGALAAWKTSRRPLSPETYNIIIQDNQVISWPDGPAFDTKGNLYFVSNKIQEFLTSTLDITQVNFKLFRAQTGRRSYQFPPFPWTK